MITRKILFALLLCVCSINFTSLGSTHKIFYYRDNYIQSKYTFEVKKKCILLTVIKTNISLDTLVTLGNVHKKAIVYDSLFVSYISIDSVIDPILIRAYYKIQPSYFSSAIVVADANSPLCVLLLPGGTHMSKYILPITNTKNLNTFVDRYQVVHSLPGHFRNIEKVKHASLYLNDSLSNPISVIFR